MIGFAALSGLLAVFLAQVWLNNQADERLKSIDAQRKAAPPARSIVVASKPLRFGDELTSAALREMPWPENAPPAGAAAMGLRRPTVAKCRGPKMRCRPARSARSPT